MRCKRPRTLWLLGAMLLATLVAAAPAAATIFVLVADIDQAQERPVPSSVPGAMGSAMITLDDVTGQLAWDISFTGLSGPAIGMHFHGPAAAGATANIIIDIGSISGLTSPSAGSTTVSQNEVGDILNELWYINIHTTTNTPGEIRGQVVPEPSGAALALAGVGTLVGLARRRQRFTRR